MIKLGKTVRDITSGFTGIAIQILEQLNGNVQIAIQPQMKEGGGYPEAMFIDHHLIEELDGDHPDLSNKVTQPAQCSINLGERVVDVASGFEGIAVAKATYMNGCISFSIVPKVKEGQLINSVPDVSWIDHTRLSKMDDGIKDIVKKPETSSNGKVPGGPAMRVNNR